MVAGAVRVFALCPASRCRGDFCRRMRLRHHLSLLSWRGLLITGRSASLVNRSGALGVKSADPELPDASALW